MNNLLAAASFRPNLLGFPGAWLGHLPFAAYVMKELNPKVFVELGSHSGNSYFAFCQAVVEANLDTKCFAVDTWVGDEHAGEYSEDIFTEVNSHNQSHYANCSRLLKMTFDDALSYFENQSINMLHIDGMHTYEAVRHDFETWLPKLAPSAVVMFHDTNVHERDFGVWKLWEELKVTYPNHLEFFHSSGLGVLQLNDSSPDNKLSLLEANESIKKETVEYFSSLGLKQSLQFDFNETKKIAKDKDIHIRNIESIVGEREEHINNLNKSLEEREEHINNLNKSLEEQAINVNYIASSYTDALRTIEGIRGSTSWRITAPVRLLSITAKNIYWVMSLIPQIVRFSGGLKGCANKIYKVLLSEGFSGVKRRILFIGGGQIGMHSSKIRLDLTSVPVNRLDYYEWVRRYDTLSNLDRKKIKLKLTKLSNNPLISVLMPVYNPPIEFLESAIQSVCNQIYQNWELCIADDASTNPAVLDLLKRYSKLDSRIKFVACKENGHISRASNAALELVSGEFVALLDHDDLLAEHALYWVVDAINKNNDAGLIYSDEDKVDKLNRRYDPYFKCDLNYELLLAQNMVCHLAVFKTSILRGLGGFRTGFEGAQDYDLVLRVIEILKPIQVVHIPHILYHWRAIAGSTALAAGEKSYAAEAGRKAVSEHLNRKGISAEVKPDVNAPALNRVHFTCPSPQPLVSIIIPTRDRADLLRMCLDSIIQKTTYSNYEIIIVDNGSVEIETFELFKQLPKEFVKVVRDESEFNFSGLNNRAAKMSRADLFCMMNNDIEILTPGWLEEMVSFAVQPEIGCVGVRLWYPDGRLQHGGCILGVGGVCGHSHKYLPQGEPGYFRRASLHQSLSVVTGACLLIRRDVFEEVGGLDEQLAVAFNDVDFCLRVRDAGYRNVWTPYAEMNHHESASRGNDNTPSKQKRFSDEVNFMKLRWGDSLLNDPAYSPNLTLEAEDFSYAWPPRSERI